MHNRRSTDRHSRPLWWGSLPTPGITDLFTTKDQVAFVDISPAYEAGAIPAATYALPADAKTIVVPHRGGDKALTDLGAK